MIIEDKKNRCREMAMILCLAGLLVGHYTDDIRIVGVAIGILFVGLIVPIWLMPLAMIWFGLGRILRVVFTTIILTLSFYFLITPVGLFRRLIGKDRLKIKQWKKNSESVFTGRDHTFEASDLENPY